jgi:hypothetical protein
MGSAKTRLFAPSATGHRPGAAFDPHRVRSPRLVLDASAVGGDHHALDLQVAAGDVHPPERVARTMPGDQRTAHSDLVAWLLTALAMAVAANRLGSVATRS